MFAGPFMRSMGRNEFRCQAPVRMRTVESTRGREAGVTNLNLDPIFESQSWNAPELLKVVGDEADSQAQRMGGNEHIH